MEMNGSRGETKDLHQFAKNRRVSAERANTPSAIDAQPCVTSLCHFCSSWSLSKQVTPPSATPVCHRVRQVAEKSLFTTTSTLVKTNTAPWLEPLRQERLR
ncbi:hypothetical protein LSAT2_012282 [Lamellibrachia satsuma]|nr:hypothetical protein LSAT2_012282 [Lamellibrachia satsuma]